MKLPEKKEFCDGFDERSNCDSNYVYGFNDCLDEVRKMNPGWISVEDRLPEKSGEVLVILSHPNMPNGYRSVDSYNTQDRMWGSSKEHTHWQPLPEPPSTIEIVGKESDDNG